MFLHDEVVQCYLHDTSIAKKYYQIYPIPPIKTVANPKRKEVVKELHARILPILQQHAFYNHALCQSLESDYDTIIDTIHLHFMVNAPQPYDVYTVYLKEEAHIYIDLIQIADGTPIVSQMMYILQQQISNHCMNIVMHKKFGSLPTAYLSQLDYQTFIEGFSLLTSWNEDIHSYQLNKETYDLRKQKAFGFLFEFKNFTLPAHQHDALLFLQQAPFWDKCTSVSGLFYLFDVYQEGGMKQLKKVYDTGYNHFIQKIFESD